MGKYKFHVLIALIVLVFGGLICYMVGEALVITERAQAIGQTVVEKINEYYAVKGDLPASVSEAISLAKSNGAEVDASYEDYRMLYEVDGTTFKLHVFVDDVTILTFDSSTGEWSERGE